MLLNELRAARYVRMSTDMQRYSLENQSDAIALYAARRGLTIVRSYEDAGRSGLRLEGRSALKNLIDDVSSGRADFKVILVYDVSRWGRFQDSDESAYYEFICRKAGVAVEYCAELFENDGSLTAAVLKNIKRAMAGEYSRELSIKVHAGQSRIAAMGFRRGSAPGYGLRRCLVDADRKRKAELAPGQWKNITTDRVILVPGPPHEIETVRRIYKMFVEERLALNRIADCLNAEGGKNAHGRPWLPTAVRDVLSNEKYIGNNMFNLTSTALGRRWRRNPRSQWIRAKGAFEPIVSRDLFDRAQHHLDENRSFTANELLDYLTAVWCRKGTISVDALNACKWAPSPGAYKRCFGGLMNAYVLLGFVKPRVNSWAKNQKFRAAMNEEVIESVRSGGGNAQRMPGGYVFRINEELTLSTSVVRRVTTDHGDKRWIFGYKTRRRPDMLIVARAAEGQETLRDYFCLPYLLMGRNWLTFSDGNTGRLGLFQSRSLRPLLDLFARVPIQLALQSSGTGLVKPWMNDLPVADNLAWPSASVEESIAGVIGRLRRILANQEFADLVCAHGVLTMPRVLAAPQQTQHAGGYGPRILNFAVVWGFVSRLLIHPEISTSLHRNWPEFPTEMKMTYLSMLTEGPAARLPSAMAFGKSEPVAGA